MHYRTSRYRTKILKNERKNKSAPKEWSWVTYSVGLTLVKPQLGYVEHCPVKIQHPANKNSATGDLIQYILNAQEMNY